ncbi:MAG: non-hydrolyzing UDP-N-acetylglucosamine 2-epimerase [Methanoculleaceae archaeon]
MKIAVAAGTRPEFIQVEPIIRELERRNIDYIFIHSGQHYDYEMDKIFFDEMRLPEPTHYLGVGSMTPGHQIGEILQRSESIFRNEIPDILLVTGDTNTALAVSLAANKSKTRIGHFEAGMRSFDKTMPEEINRIVIDNISDYHFSPTERGIKNLLESSINNNIYLVGDVMLDSIVHYRELILQPSRIIESLSSDSTSYYLLTLHREANTDNKIRLKNILSGVSSISHPVIFPIHPRTKMRIKEFGLKIPDNIHAIPPLGYFEFLRIISNSVKVLTDSGGVQKQAFFLSKPCITLRPNTEWMETVEQGWNILVDDSPEKIKIAIEEFHPSAKPDVSVFGNGDAARKIVDVVEQIPLQD